MAILRLLRPPAASTGHPDVHVELSYLVSVLSWSWYLDWTCPVEVEVTQSVAELLNLQSRQARLILGHIEVGRLDASLSRRGRRHVEVELLVALIVVHHQFGVDDAA